MAQLINDKNAKTILVVEDDIKMQRVLKDRLTSERFKITLASDGEEALRKTQTATFDLILLDIILPKMNGLEFLKRFKGNDKNKNVPVIILTNLQYDDYKIVELMEKGATDYLVKAKYSLNELVRKIKEKIGK